MRLKGIIARVLVVLASLNLVAGPVLAGAQSINLKVQGNLAEAADKAKIAKAATDKVAQTGAKAARTFNILGDQPWGEAFQTGLFGGTKLTAANVLEGALDGAITSGLSSAVYGTNFADGFKNSLIRTIVSLGLADAQIGIGTATKEAGFGEGSLPHALLHGIAGCTAAELTGASCGAGAVGAVVQSLYAGSLAARDVDLSDPQRRARAVQNAELIGAVAGFFASGGKGENVSAAASIARSGFQNNFLYHAEARIKADAENAITACEEGGQTCSEAELADLRATVTHYEALDQSRDAILSFACQNPLSGLCTRTVYAARQASYSYLGQEDRNELKEDWLNAAYGGAGSGPAWDPGAFGLGLAAGATLGLNGAAGVAVVREAARLCGSNPTCTAAVVGQLVGAEVIAEFSGGAAVITALDGTIINRIDLNPPAIIRPIGGNRTFDFTSNGAGNDLRRFTTLDGTDVRINSGHAYNRTHAGGDVSQIGTMDEIENAILRDISANSRLGSLQPRTTQTHTVQVNGQTVEYSLADIPSGVNINYYPVIE